MPSLGLITTGECEHRALGASLQRVFDGAELDVVQPFRRPVPSITSNYLSYPGPEGGETQVDKLVRSMMAALTDRNAPDFVLVVDDLELPNVATAHHVPQLIADAVRRYLGRPIVHREAAEIRDRCSFHLLCPMLEAYFFGERAALERARARRPAVLDPLRHLEDFHAIDPEFLAPLDARSHAWRRPDRGRHPKRYLSFLVDPSGEEPASYRESVDGANALATLDWPQVLAHVPAGIAFAYSLFEDIADMLGVACRFQAKLIR